jgi:hypothetical protein
MRPPCAKLLLGVVLAASASLPLQARGDDGGGTLSPSLQELEKQIAADPSDPELRWRLLRLSLPPKSPEVKAIRLETLLWVIANTPEVEIAGSPFARVHHLTEPAAYEKARNLWLSQLKQQPSNLKVLLNAGRFFATDDPSLSGELFRKGAELDPDNPEWATRLASLRKSEPAGDQAKQDSALSVLEPALSKATSQEERYHSLAKVAEAALDSGEDGKARAYAEELLRLGETLPQDWNYGNAVHDGNRILGHLALKAGDIDAAKTFLLRSGETVGSPQLNTFGPSLTLAQALLAKGERDVVVRYLEMCSRFWEERDEAIGKWIADIRAGKNPDLNRFKAFRSHS